MAKQKTKLGVACVGGGNRPKPGAHNEKRRELFDAQDRIDEQRDGLIGKIEKQLKQKQSVQPLFTVWWRLR